MTATAAFERIIQLLPGSGKFYDYLLPHIGTAFQVLADLRSLVLSASPGTNLLIACILLVGLYYAMVAGILLLGGLVGSVSALSLALVFPELPAWALVSTGALVAATVITFSARSVRLTALGEIVAILTGLMLVAPTLAQHFGTWLVPTVALCAIVVPRIRTLGYWAIITHFLIAGIGVQNAIGAWAVFIAGALALNAFTLGAILPAGLAVRGRVSADQVVDAGALARLRQRLNATFMSGWTRAR